jgi:hypothetical protein
MTFFALLAAGRHRDFRRLPAARNRAAPIPEPMDDQISAASCCAHPRRSKVVDPAVRTTDALTGSDPRRA